MKLKKHFKAFTLVELIIVITILAILATIAFVSFQGYVKDSRDSTRLTTLKNIESGLQAFQVKTGNYPEPENYTLIQASGTTITYQGYVGDTISKLVKINKTPIDPLDQTRFIYTTNKNKTKYEILSHIENKNQVSYLNRSYAIDYSQRGIKTIGHSLGILLNQDNSPILESNIDILKSNSGTTYKIYFGGNMLTATGKQILTTYTIADKSISDIDDSLIGYWDMENVIFSGGLSYTKDLSQYQNHGIIGTGLSVTTGVGGSKGYLFKGLGTSSYIDLGTTSTLKPSIFTISAWMYMNDLATCYNYIFTNCSDIGGNKGIDFKVYCSTALNGRIDEGNAATQKTADYIIPNPIGWKHVALSYDKTVLKLYLNGELIRSVNSNLEIGQPPTSFKSYLGSIGTHYNGTEVLDDIRMYNRTLSNSEIQQIYNTTK